MEGNRNMSRRKIEESIYNELPKELRSLTENFEGREKDIVLTSTIGVLSNCLPNVYGYYSGDKIYPHLFVIIIAPPASGKGTMNYARLLIQDIHNKILSDSRKEYIDCQERKKKKDDRDNAPCSPIQIKILPANTSTAEMYSYLGSSKHGLLIIESEADTMGQMLKNDWSNYSDVLRKAFHHEPISISRKIEKVFEDIPEPKLAMVLSGTPDQLKSIIQSKQNGLYSRFIIYSFDEISKFKDVFAPKNKKSKDVFRTIGKDIFNLYGHLTKLKEPLEFSLTPKQREEFLKKIEPIHNDITKNTEDFTPNLYRHGLIMFRIAMIFTVIRNRKNIIKGKSFLVCSNEDFINSFNLTKTLLRHSLYVFKTLDNGFLSIQDEKILDDLGNNRDRTFNRKGAILTGQKYGVPIRTMDDKLSKWQKRKIIRKISKGTYKKL